MIASKIARFVHTRIAMSAAAPVLSLAFGLKFPDLYDREGLVRLDNAFYGWLREADAALHER